MELKSDREVLARNHYAGQSDPVDKQREIPTVLQQITKALHELREEVLGLNGTFGMVLRGQAPGAAGTAPTPSYSTDVGNALHSILDEVDSITSEARSIRERCEL